MRTFTIAVYLVLGAGVLALVVISRIRPWVVAPLGVMLERALAQRPARVVVVLFWWWLAWHFLVARTVDTPPS
jgi:hypothetical protein